MTSAATNRLDLWDQDGKVRFWWAALASVPSSPESWEYRRLKRVWFDHTINHHPFVTPTGERHLTVSLFENFAALPAASWLPALLEAAGLPEIPERLTAVNWGYEVGTEARGKYADVAIHARDPEDLVIVVEAKARGGTLKPDDHEPGSYLDLPAFSWCERRYLIYLVDEADVESLETKAQELGVRSGILTWQQLGGIQIEAARHVDAPERVASLLAGAIQFQFVERSIVPSRLAAEYLEREPATEEIHKDAPGKQTSTEREIQEWRLTEPQALPDSALAPCMYEPTETLREALSELSAAADCVVRGDLEEAKRSLTATDRPEFLEYYTRCTNRLDRPLAREPKARLPRDERLETRMPGDRLRRELYERDGWHCRFCGIGVIDPRALKLMAAKLPTAARWGTGNANCHSAMLILRASPDHVLPHSHGGDNAMENLVTACFLCQFSRGELLLDEVGVSDPRLRPPIRDVWDGLLRVLEGSAE